MLLNPSLRAVARTRLRYSIVGLIRTRTTLAAKSGPGVPPSILSGWYNIFGKSNAGYMAWIVGGVLVGELMFGFTTDAVWNSVNNGRTYGTVDWSKFKTDDDDEEEDDDEDEDEEEDDEDEDEEEDDEDEDDEEDDD